MNLTQWREGRKDTIIALSLPIFTPDIPDFYPVIPAKAGIQRIADKPAIRNQA